MSEYVVAVNDKKLKIFVQNDTKIFANGREYIYELLQLDGKKYLLKLNNSFIEVTNKILNDSKFSVLIKSNIYETAVHSILQEKAENLLNRKVMEHHKIEVKAPMPGMILKIKKNISDRIFKGETVLILEAMKMENDLQAPHSGIIKEILVKEGNAIEKGKVLFTIE
jgi:biotin carboxyl carrier protein